MAEVESLKAGESVKGNELALKIACLETAVVSNQALLGLQLSKNAGHQHEFVSVQSAHAVFTSVVESEQMKKLQERIVELQGLLLSADQNFSEENSKCDVRCRQLQQLQVEPIRVSVRRGQADLLAAREQLASLKSTDAAVRRVREYEMRKNSAEQKQALDAMRLKCDALQKSLNESQAAYRLLENQVLDNSKMSQKVLRLQAEIKAAHAACKDTELQGQQRCAALERSILQSQQHVQLLHQQLKTFNASADAAPPATSSAHADRAAPGGGRSCCDGYRRRCEALQENLIAEKKRTKVLSAQLGDSISSFAAAEAKNQTLMEELSARNAAVKALQKEIGQQRSNELLDRLASSQAQLRIAQEEADRHERAASALELQLNHAHELNACSAAAREDAALRITELEACILRMETKLTETLRLQDEQTERRAVEQMSAGGSGCSMCATLRAHAATVESQLAATLGDLDTASFDHARTLRHAASALHELQQQLLGAREKQVAGAELLLQREAELGAMQQLVEELERKEEEGEVLKRLHAEAAEAFLQQAQALQSSGKVCLKCLRSSLEQTGEDA